MRAGRPSPRFPGVPTAALPLCPRAKKVEALPTSCLFGALCDHRWSGLGPRGGFKVLPPSSQGVAPKNKISRIRRSCSAPLKPGFGDSLARTWACPADCHSVRGRFCAVATDRRSDFRAPRVWGSELCSLKAHTFQLVIIRPQRFISRKKWASATVTTPSAERL